MLGAHKSHLCVWLVAVLGTPIPWTKVLLPALLLGVGVDGRKQVKGKKAIIYRYATISISPFQSVSFTVQLV